MSKEFVFDNYKAIDNGHELTIYKKRKDDFGTEFFQILSNQRYKEDPNKPKSTNTTRLLSFDDEHIQDFGIILKFLLEENEHLKWHNKVSEKLDE